MTKEQYDRAGALVKECEKWDGFIKTIRGDNFRVKAMSDGGIFCVDENAMTETLRGTLLDWAFEGLDNAERELGEI